MIDLTSNSYVDAMANNANGNISWKNFPYIYNNFKIMKQFWVKIL